VLHDGIVICDLWPWNFLRLYLQSGCRFWIGICRDDVLGDKGVLHGWILVMWRPMTLTQWPFTLKFPSALNDCLQKYSYDLKRCVCWPFILHVHVVVLNIFNLGEKVYNYLPTPLESVAYYVKTFAVYPYLSVCLLAWPCGRGLSTFW
jgi:hypothetical protein